MMKTIKLTPRERFMDANPNMQFTDMATQLNLSYAAIKRTYDRLQKKRALIAAMKTGEKMFKLRIDICSGNGHKFVAYFTDGNSVFQLNEFETEEAAKQYADNLSNFLGGRTIQVAIA